MPIHIQICPQGHRAEMRVAWDDKTPPCPACGVPTERSYAYNGVTSFRDDIPGGITLENYGKDPVTFYSHTERRAYMQKHGLFEKEKFCPFPGTDKDPQGIPNPKGYIDPYTLENARILVERQQLAGGKKEEFDPSTVLTHLQTGDISEADVVAISHPQGDRRRQSRFHRRMTRD
jgi:hypothetical protein